MTPSDPGPEHMEFLLRENGMPVSAGGPPWRELLPRPGHRELLTLDLTAIPAPDRYRVIDELRAIVARASVR
jgi:hypothetical protein